VDEVFRSFDETPIASASVAQVHFAELPDGTPSREGAAAEDRRR
jgi:ubiquinone biosynthesis protein